MEQLAAVPTYAHLVEQAMEDLAEAGVETARLDAEVLLAHAMRCERTALLARLREEADPLLQGRFDALLSRRLSREPVAYIRNVQEFWSLRFAVSPVALIPRPETELVVEVALRRARLLPAPRLCDVGTGSGCIAVAIAHELPRARLLAVDISHAALALAERNARHHDVHERVELRESDLFSAVAPGEKFDLVVSNPPYVADTDPISLEVLCEPHQALSGGADGLDVIRRLVAEAPAHLVDGGWLVFEFGHEQAPAVREIVAAAGCTDMEVHDDLAGVPRVVAARKGNRR